MILKKAINEKEKSGAQQFTIFMIENDSMANGSSSNLVASSTKDFYKLRKKKVLKNNAFY
jgi:hypothetical protein